MKGILSFWGGGLAAGTTLAREVKRRVPFMGQLKMIHFGGAAHGRDILILQSLSSWRFFLILLPGRGSLTHLYQAKACAVDSTGLAPIPTAQWKDKYIVSWVYSGGF